MENDENIIFLRISTHFNAYHYDVQITKCTR